MRTFGLITETQQYDLFSLVLLTSNSKQCKIHVSNWP